LKLCTSLNCDDFYECYQQEISERAKCYGYASCIQTTITGDEAVQCDGDRSCYQSSIDVGDSVKCRSTQSCASSAVNSGDTVYCEGSHSCAQSDISGNAARLYGHYAAAMSSITDTQTVTASGYNSLLFATVDSNDLTKMEVRVDGLNAGYGASVVCRDGATCKLVCGLNGCDHLDFYCFHGADCNISPSGCVDGKQVNSVDEVDGTVCPTVKWSKYETTDLILEQDLARRYHNIAEDLWYIEWLEYLNEDMELWQQREEEFTPPGTASKKGNAKILAVTSGPAMFARFGHSLQFSLSAVGLVLVVMVVILAAFGFAAHCSLCTFGKKEVTSYQTV